MNEVPVIQYVTFTTRIKYLPIALPVLLIVIHKSAKSKNKSMASNIYCPLIK
jgi:hypothetical protein